MIIFHLVQCGEGKWVGSGWVWVGYGLTHIRLNLFQPAFYRPIFDPSTFNPQSVSTHPFATTHPDSNHFIAISATIVPDFFEYHRFFNLEIGRLKNLIMG